MSEEMMLKFNEGISNYNNRKSYVKMVVCDILGYGENNMYNQLVGEFYEEYLRKHFLPIVIEEYQITPMVEMMLAKMSPEEKNVFANNLLVYIENIVASFKNNDFQSAVLMFVYMNSFLRKTMNNVGILAIDTQIDEIKEKQNEFILIK